MFTLFLSVHCSAIIEHTNQVIFLEDDDVAAVMNGSLTIHRLKRNFDDPNESTVREVISLQMEIQQIMKGAVRVTFLYLRVYVVFTVSGITYGVISLSESETNNGSDNENDNYWFYSNIQKLIMVL